MSQPNLSRASQELLRTIAVRLRKLGVPREIVVEALQVPKWTVAGWLAHDTLKHRRAA